MWSRRELGLHWTKRALLRAFHLPARRPITKAGLTLTRPCYFNCRIQGCFGKKSDFGGIVPFMFCNLYLDLYMDLDGKSSAILWGKAPGDLKKEGREGSWPGECSC